MKSSNYTIYSATDQAWEAMLVAIRDAHKSIYWEVYMVADDESGNKFFDLLEHKARAGVDVKLIVDYWGSLALSNKKITQLKASGVDIRRFEDRKRRHLIWWGLFSSRTHRKILIVDEKIGFIGGVNVRHFMKNWLDIYVQVEGKIVRSLLRSFAKSYIICGGEREAVKPFLKYNYRVLKSQFDLITDEPNIGNSKVKDNYVRALNRARERVILFSPYYFPDREFLAALYDAKKRGVRLDLLIPLRTDLRVATYAAFAWFALMRKIGVNVHVTPHMMHGKGIVVDNNWAMIGSSNIDQTSFFYNHEANISSQDRGFVHQLKNILEGWIQEAEPVGTTWEKRGWLNRAKEWLALKLYNWWFGVKQ